MTVETATKVSELNATLPADGDSRSEGDNHLRVIKTAILGTLANADTTGVAGFNVVTQAIGNNGTLAASTAFVSAGIAAAALSATLPSQAGNSGKVITTDGTNGSWSSIKTVNGSTILSTGDIQSVLPRTEVTGTTQTAAAYVDYWLENAGATAVTANASPVDGERFAVTPANSLYTNTIDFGSATVRGPAGTVTGVLTLNLGARMEFKYSTTLTKWVVQ